MTRTQERYDAYRARDDGPIGLVSLVVVTIMLINVTDAASQQWRTWLATLGAVLWVVLLADLVTLVRLAPDRPRFFRTNLVYVIGVLFPPLRILLLGRVVRFLRSSSRSKLADRITLVVLIVTVEVVVLSALAEVLVERKAPSATIQNMGDGLWWAVITVSTVGYGDLVPVTAAGQVIGTLVIVVGIVLLAVVTANIASRFVQLTQGADPEPPTGGPDAVPAAPEGTK